MHKNSKNIAAIIDKEKTATILPKINEVSSNLLPLPHSRANHNTYSMHLDHMRMHSTILATTGKYNNSSLALQSMANSNLNDKALVATVVK